MQQVIGVDFDNTLVSYDNLFYEIGLKQKLVEPDISPTKTVIRDRIRRLKDGEQLWQSLQAQVYGLEIRRAKIFAGAENFIDLCRSYSIPLCIVSHKTEIVVFEDTTIDLRAVAFDWLKEQNIFNQNNLLTSAQVYFESTRLDKIKRIKSLGCNYFIDDLIDIFQEDGFPEKTEKILFSPLESPPLGFKGHIFRDWFRITKYFEKIFYV